MNKEQAIFYLSRVIKNMEKSGAVFDQYDAARRGISHQERLKMQQKAEESNPEYKALLWIKDYLSTLP